MSIPLHPQLASDCHHLGTARFCEVLLHRNASVPWFILAPETQLQDFLDLPPAQRSGVLAECAAVSRFIRREWNSPKINFGAIGNVVPQMHLHVIGRRPDDPCWPKPVWGNLPTQSAYPDGEPARLWESLQPELAAATTGEGEAG